MVQVELMKYKFLNLVKLRGLQIPNRANQYITCQCTYYHDTTNPSMFIWLELLQSCDIRATKLHVARYCKTFDSLSRMSPKENCRFYGFSQRWSRSSGSASQSINMLEIDRWMRRHLENRLNIFSANVVEVYSPAGWGCRLRQLHFCRGISPPPTSECPRYDTKLHLIVRLLARSFEECGVFLHCHYT